MLARAIARGAGVEAPMPSPTFNLVLRYTGRDGITVTHIDLFRLERAADVWELGWEEIGEGREIVLVEWPERAGSLLPNCRWDISLRAGSEPHLREVVARPMAGAPPIPDPDDD